MNNDKFVPSRTLPSQARGKERVRLILATSAELFDQRGVAEVSTNDIALAAHIPVGSVYRYFDSKNAILQSLIALHGREVAAVIRHIAENPLVSQMSWYEILTLVLNAWSEYRVHNKSRAFLKFARSDPKLTEAIAKKDEEQYRAFSALAAAKRGAPDGSHKRQTDLFLAFQYCRATVDMLSDPHFPAATKEALIEAAANGIGAGLEAAEAETE